MGCITISFNLAALNAVLPTMSRELGILDFVASQMITFYLIPYGVAALLYAPLTQYFSYRKIYLWSMLLYAIAAISCAFLKSFGLLLAARCVMGAAAAGIIPLGLMIISESLPKEIRGKLVGIFFGSTFIGSLMGVAVAALTNWKWLFYVPAGLALFMVLLMLFIRSEILDRIHAEPINYWSSLADIQIRNIFIFIFLISFLYHSVSTWYGIYLDRIYKLDQFFISLIVMLTLVGAATGQIFGGHLSDIKGRIASCKMGVAGLAISTMFLVGKYPLFIVIPILFFISFFWTVGHNGISTILADVGKKDRAVVASLNSSIRFFSAGLGIWLSRFFVQQNFGLTFLCIGILIYLLYLWLKTWRHTS